MGVVYRARDETLDREVAVKVLSPSVSEGQFHERFLQEARLAASLSHPNLVAVYDAGEDEETGRPFLVMELVEGESIRDWMAARGPRPPAQAASVVRQAAEGLHQAHSKGIIHRDVKPGNLMLSPGGEIKITDFGIARPGASDLTRTGQLLGTPHYMAPEQVTGETVDARADVFALGVVLYELLTGEKPFSGDTLTAVSYRLINTDPPPASALRPSVPEDLERIVRKALAKDPAERYASAEALARELAAFEATAGESQEARQPAAADSASPGQTMMLEPSGSGSPRGDGGRILVAAAGTVVIFGCMALLLWILPSQERVEGLDVASDSSFSASRRPRTEDSGVTPYGGEIDGGPSAEVSGQESPSPRPSPPPGPAVPAAEAGRAAGSAGPATSVSLVRFVFRHGQPEGRFTLRVDDRPVHETDLDAEGVFSKVEVRGSFEVPAGTHTVEAVLVLGSGPDAQRLVAAEQREFRGGENHALLLKLQKFIRNPELKMYWDSRRAERALAQDE